VHLQRGEVDEAIAALHKDDMGSQVHSGSGHVCFCPVYEGANMKKLGNEQNGYSAGTALALRE
jgi:hypothetical protein